MALSSVGLIPIYIVYSFLSTPGTFREVRISIWLQIDTTDNGANSIIL